MRRGPTPINIGQNLSLGTKAPWVSGSWMEQAACREASDTAFFVDMFPVRKGDEIASAKRIRAKCPVREECLRTGGDEEFGIWGGLTALERRRFPSPRPHCVN